MSSKDQKQIVLAEAVAELNRQWSHEMRCYSVKRPYSAADVIRLRGSMHIEHTLARHGALKLRELLRTEPYVAALGAMTGNQAFNRWRPD